MDERSIASSFYEPLEEYDEEKSKELYKNLKDAFQEINESIERTRKMLSDFEKQSTVTTKLVEALQSAKINDQ